MLAGDPLRRTNNASNFADQAISFVCLGEVLKQTQSYAIPLIRVLQTTTTITLVTLIGVSCLSLS